MLLVLFSLRGVTFESLALSAFGSSCWLWELPCIDLKKKKTQVISNVAGERA